MAEQKAEQIGFEIKLNEVFVGKRTLRYIYLYHPDVVSTECDESRECIPLFLGSDVLVECNVSRGNLPRVHAKHAKRGLATKVNFPPGCKVLGIHGTARGVWFYSIQGTFKIAFDYYSREDQDGCLRQLQKIWRRQILDPILKKEVQVVLRKELETSHEAQSGGTMDVTCEKDLDCKVVDFVELVEQINQTINNFSLATGNETLEQELGLLRTYVSFISLEDHVDSFVNRIVKLLRNCLRLLPAILETNNFSESSDFSESINNYSESNNSSESDNFSESNNVSKSNNVSESNNLLESSNLPESNIFSKKEAVLLEIAQWLGTEFANNHAYVNERVTAFKQKHIKSIENLPSAELLVNEVFPASMQVLLRCWLQLPAAENQNMTNEGSENASRLFPVVQLILELANQSLLSGVAHVLYSRLIRSESV